MKFNKVDSTSADFQFPEIFTPTPTLLIELFKRECSQGKHVLHFHCVLASSSFICKLHNLKDILNKREFLEGFQEQFGSGSRRCWLGSIDVNFVKILKFPIKNQWITPSNFQTLQVRLSTFKSIYINEKHFFKQNRGINVSNQWKNKLWTTSS